MVRFYREGTREIKPKKLTNVDWRKAGYKSFAEFQGDVSSLKAEVSDANDVDVEKALAEKRREAQCLEAEDRSRYHILRLREV